MAVKPPSSSGSERQDVAIVDAYERRLKGETTPGLSAQDEAEIEAYLALHDQVARIDLPEVAPSVRGLVLSAAAQAIEEREKTSSLKHFLSWLLRPGPAVVAMTAAAIAVAIAVRPQPAQSPPAAGAQAETTLSPEAVAVLEPAREGAEPAREAAPTLPAEAPPPALPAAAPMVAEAARAVEPPAPAKAEPLHTIAAQPASLGPQEAAPVDAPARRLVEARPAAQGYKNNDRLAAGDLDLAPKAKAQAAPAPQAEKEVANRAPVAQEAPPPQQAPEQNANVAEAQGQFGQAAGKAAPSYRFQDDLADRTASMAPGAKGANSMANQQRARAAAGAATAGAANNAEGVAVNPVAQARADVEKAADAPQRFAALKRLALAARAAGDAKTEAWALAEMKTEAERTAQRQAQKKAAAPVQQPQQAAPRASQMPATTNQAPTKD